jgi:ABC-type dipeptide/oligopeptide/nickel transport system permease component
VIAFVARRLALGAVVLVALSCITFCFFTWEAQGGSLGSLLSQWWTWARGVWNGPSLDVLNQPTASRNFMDGATLNDAVRHTAILLAFTLVLVVLLSVGLAVLAAARRGSGLDVTLRALSYAAWAVPAFLLALLVQLLVNTVGGARGIGPFPLAGWPGSCPAGIGINAGRLTPCPAAGSGADYALNALRYVTLPAVTLAIGFVGLHARYLRSALLETLDAPFVTTARAKGLPERRVLVRHALRASLATFVAALLADFGAILGACFAVDYVFELNGLGTVFINQFPTGQSTVDPKSMVPALMLAALFVIVASILADATVFWLDPRARTNR